MAAAPNRAEGASTEENGAASAPATAAPSSGGIGAWLPLIVMIVLMPALAFAMTNFVIVPKLQKGLGGGGTNTSVAAGESSGKSKKEGPAAKKESVAMNKLLVNVAGTGGARYLLVSLSVVGSGANFKEQMDSHDAQLRDMAQGALRTKTIADLEKPTAQNMIRNELISGFNNILGDGSVEEIYFPEFAIQ
ncbi:MAG TPA: flagellar basal body-associated FliL family protein [Verrucomicrobiae bacterium]|nr:flagellar basal body-associated FliL family protein [Verrucomicrobiae bacterium]